MRKFLVLISLLLISYTSIGQELNCEVVVNADRVTSVSEQVFKTLETSVNEFVNQTKWTNKEFKIQERINCSMLISITKQVGSDNYEATIQVQSSRPVFNSIYSSPLINFKDSNFNFSYTEHAPLVFDKNVYQSELVSVISYYVYLILGVDADSFEKNGGDEYYKICRTITDQVDNPNSKPGWKSNTSKVNRYHLIDKILASSNTVFRTTLYNYHRNGLDLMESKKKQGKNAISEAIINLRKMAHNSMSSMIFRFFMDAKADEIVNIFSGGPNIETVNLKNALNKLSPTNASKWAEIK